MRKLIAFLLLLPSLALSQVVNRGTIYTGIYPVRVENSDSAFVEVLTQQGGKAVDFIIPFDKSTADSMRISVRFSTNSAGPDTIRWRNNGSTHAVNIASAAVQDTQFTSAWLYVGDIASADTFALYGKSMTARGDIDIYFASYELLDLSPGGGGSTETTTVKEGGASVGTANDGTFDFGAGFDVTESPADEFNIVLDYTEDPPSIDALAGEIAGVTSDGDTLKVQLGTSLNAIDLEVNNSTVFSVDTVGNITANNISGTNTGDEALSTSSAGLTVSDHAVDLNGSQLFVADADTVKFQLGVSDTVFAIEINNQTKLWADSTGKLEIVDDFTAGGNITATGNVSGSNLIGTNTGDQTITTASAGIDITGADQVDLDVTPSSGSATLIQEEDALQVKYTSPLTEGASGLALNQNAGTDITADLEEEAHASEHQDGGADEINLQGLDAISDGDTLKIRLNTDLYGIDYEVNDTRVFGVDTVGNIVANNVLGVRQNDFQVFTSYTDSVHASEYAEIDTTNKILKLNGQASQGGRIGLQEDSDNGTNFTGFEAPASLAGNILYTLPSAGGSAGQVLHWTAGNILTWDTDDTGGGGMTVQEGGTNVSASPNYLTFNPTSFNITDATVADSVEVAIADIYLLINGDAVTGNLDFNDGTGDTPKILFTPQTGTAWQIYAEDTDDDLQITTNTGTTETIDIVNAGAGVVDVTIDGTITAGNVSGTNTGDETLSTSSAGLDVSDHVIDIDVTPGTGAASLAQTDDALQFAYSATLAADPAMNSLNTMMGANGILFEGTTADGIEGLLRWPTITSSDKTITLSDNTGTVVLHGAAVTDVAGTGLAVSGTTLNFAANEALGDLTWYTGAQQNRTWTYAVTGTDPVIKFSSDSVNVTTGTLREANNRVMTTFTKSLLVESPVAGDSMLAFGPFPYAVTVDSVRAVLDGAGGVDTDTLTFMIKHATNFGQLGENGTSADSLFSTAQAVDDFTTGERFSTFQDPTIPADRWIGMYIATQNGTVEKLLVTLYMRRD